MNKLLTIFTSVSMLLVYSSTIYGQKLMKLDDELKANSKPIEAKLKGISTIGKYEFGPYRIVSGKAGWRWIGPEPQKFKSGSETISEIKNKSSFVFTINDKDTILVNTTTNGILSQSESQGLFGDVTTINESMDNYTALISPSYDTTIWKMVMVSRSGAEVIGKNRAEGILTNGIMDIQIKMIKQWEDGKNATFKMICGYGFFIDNKEIAAVQSNDFSDKKYVWLHQKLDEQMKSILAAASASLMVHTN